MATMIFTFRFIARANAVYFPHQAALSAPFPARMPLYRAEQVVRAIS